MAESSIFNSWDSVVAPVRNELVFEDRNKEYGAYEIRKTHNKSIFVALIITIATFAFVVSLPKIIELISGLAVTPPPEIDITPIELTPPPPLDETLPPPPPPPPPPVMETVRFTPPVVTDEEVVEDPPPVITEETPQISTVTQEGDPDAIIIPEENVVVEAVVEAPLTIVEQMPTFPGGEAEMMKYIQKNVQYPQVEKEAGISGTCYVTFVVEKDGSITDVKVLRGVSGGPGCDKEAKRVVNSMPAWKAGKQNGREVRVQFNLPIKFTLR